MTLSHALSADVPSARVKVFCPAFICKVSPVSVEEARGLPFSSEHEKQMKQNNVQIMLYIIFLFFIVLSFVNYLEDCHIQLC